MCVYILLTVGEVFEMVTLAEGLKPKTRTLGVSFFIANG